VESLAKEGVLRVHSRKGHGIECRLPLAAPTSSETVSPSQPRAGNIERVPAGAAPASDAEVERRQLAAELLGRPVDESIMVELQAGADSNADRPGATHGPGSLLRRLRELKMKGLHFQDVTSMALAVAKHYWL